MESGLPERRILPFLREKKHISIRDLSKVAKEKEIPKLNFNSIVELDSSTFAEAITDASIVADSCAISAAENSFIIEAKGSLNSAKTELSSDEVKIKTQGESKAKYSLDYFVKFAKASKLSPNIAISFSNDYPVRLDFKNESLDLSFILAPRVEEE